MSECPWMKHWTWNYWPLKLPVQKTFPKRINNMLIIAIYFILFYCYCVDLFLCTFLCMQDLWIPYFNITTDITASTMRVHTDGRCSIFPFAFKQSCTVVWLKGQFTLKRFLYLFFFIWTVGPLWTVPTLVSFIGLFICHLRFLSIKYIPLSSHKP